MDISMQLADEEWKLELWIGTFEHWFQSMWKGFFCGSRGEQRQWATTPGSASPFRAKLPPRGSPVRADQGEVQGRWGLILLSPYKSSCSPWGQAASNRYKYRCHLNLFMASSLICSFWPILHSVPEHLPFISGFCYIILIFVTFLWPWTHNSFSYRLAHPQCTHAFFHPGSHRTW